ncbi:MAG: hypothetical protein JWM28_1242 [Chitinophagaceae bacterium]|nr:hypothetical protein [Chitinophagaceae bacterium]
MKLILFCTAILLLSGYPGSAQSLPVIRAQSTNADIRDGLHFRKGYWYIMPEKKPDRYYAELPGKPHRVIFYTDIDSISFDVAYGGVYNFVILLNNKDSCYIQIVAAPKTIIGFTSDLHSNSQTPDTIPFTIGKNNKLFIKGIINQSDSLNFQFDLGSSYSILKSESIKKANIKLDSAARDGESVSSHNQLSIAGLRWDSIQFHQYDRNMSGREDGLLGNSLFQNKILEINYDRKWIIIHDTLPAMDTSYSRHEMILLDGVVPMMQASLATRDTSCTTWFIFDTGDSGNAWIDDSTASRFQLYRGVTKIIRWGDRVIVKIPEFRIANSSFFNVSAILAKRGTHSQDVSLLGNSLLKRFNVVLDNRNGIIYLKPNSLMSEPYDNTVLLIYGGITVAVLALFILILIIRSISRKRKLKQNEYPEPDYS